MAGVQEDEPREESALAHPIKTKLLLLPVFVALGCGSTTVPQRVDAGDAGTKPDLAQVGSPDLAAPDVPADGIAVEREDALAADALPALDLAPPDVFADDLAAERVDVGVDVALADALPAPDLAAPDLRDGKAEEVALVDVGADTSRPETVDLVGSDGSPLDLGTSETNSASCVYKTSSGSLYIPPTFDFSLVQADGSSLSCSTRFNADGGPPYWPSPISSHISGRVSAASATDFSVDTCENGTGCTPAVYRFTVKAAGLSALGIPVGRRVTVSWWMFYGGWSCQRMLVVTDDAASDAGAGAPQALWLAGVDSLTKSQLPLPFSFTRQELFCNPAPSVSQGCGGNDVPPDDYAFEFTPLTADPSLLLATGQTDTLALTLGTGVVQHIKILTLRCFQTQGCDDYGNWAWWATGHAGPNGDPD
jgi:hypothetical protein